jgi:hypothetical protein
MDFHSCEQGELQSSRNRLCEYTRLLNLHGVDSRIVADYLVQNRSDEEFVQLAETVRALKLVLCNGTEDEKSVTDCGHDCDRAMS